MIQLRRVSQFVSDLAEEVAGRAAATALPAAAVACSACSYVSFSSFASERAHRLVFCLSVSGCDNNRNLSYLLPYIVVVYSSGGGDE